MKIMAQSTNLLFEIEFHGKYLNLVGNSAAGKTTFYNIVNDYLNGVVGNTVVIDKDISFETLPVRIDPDYIMSRSGMLFILDETCKLLRGSDVGKLFRDSKNYFIIISRKVMKFLPLSVDNYCILDESNGIIRNVPRFPRFITVEPYDFVTLSK